MQKKIFTIFVTALMSVGFINCSPSQDSGYGGNGDFELQASGDCGTGDCEMSKSSVASRSFQQELVEKELTDFYQLYLQREPDAAGLDFWSTHILNKNITGTQAKDYLKKSPEAQSLGEPPEYQPNYDLDNLRLFTCSAQSSGIGRTLSSREGYVTRFRVNSGLQRPNRGRYKEGSSFYCQKQRIFCWANQVRTRVVNIKPMLSRYSSCNEATFAGQPETDYDYIQALGEDLSDIYQRCQGREPTSGEIDRHISHVVENKGSVSDVAATICRW